MAQISKIVLAEYHKFLLLFSEVEANKLPPHYPYNYRIPLKEGFTPPFGPIYSLSQTELEALKKLVRGEPLQWVYLSILLLSRYSHPVCEKRQWLPLAMY
jgi:hypothetical protein